MGTDLHFQCQCGAVEGVVRNAGPRAGVRALCYCGDCQAFAFFLGRENGMLDAHGGTDIYQTAASRLEIREGLSHIARVVVSPSGLNRWYAACCNSALANTPANRALPFVGTFFANYDRARRDAVIGPVATAVFAKEAWGAPAQSALPMPIILADMLRRALGEWVSGRWRRHALYAAADAGQVPAPTVLSAEERTRLDRKAAARKGAFVAAAS